MKETITEIHLLDTINSMTRPVYKTPAEQEAYMQAFYDLLNVLGMEWVEEMKIKQSEI